MTQSDSQIRSSASSEVTGTGAGVTGAARSDSASTDTAPATLEVRNLSVKLAGKTVLDSVNLEVKAGEFVALLGPNGAGKTTFFRSVLGLLRTQSGTIRHGGIGYVPQRHEFAWDYPISVQDTVLNGRAGLRKIGRPLKKEDVRATAEALRRVGLWELRHRPIGQLSGGQRQRVLVARALVVKPELLLLDEPFTGMDYPNIESLSELLQHLCSTGISVLMISHDLAHAVAVCDRVVLFRTRIIADGSPEQLRSAEPWMETFSVSESSPLLRGIGLVQDSAAPSSTTTNTAPSTTETSTALNNTAQEPQDAQGGQQ